MRAIVLIVLAGCFSRPDFAVGDGGPTDVVEIDSACPSTGPGGLSIQGRRVSWTGSDRYVVFADETQVVPMPEEISVTGTNLIGAPVGCGVEDRIGVAMYPLLSTGSGTPNDVFSLRSLTRLADGAAYASFRIDWHHDLLCGQTMPNFAIGESRFSMFPNGKIVRHDIVTPSTMLDGLVPDDCDPCVTGTGATSSRATTRLRCPS